MENTSQFNEGFTKSYSEENDEGYFLEVEKLLANLHVKTEYLIHIRNLKQILNHGHGLVSKKVDRLIKFNQNAKTIS